MGSNDRYISHDEYTTDLAIGVYILDLVKGVSIGQVWHTVNRISSPLDMVLGPGE